MLKSLLLAVALAKSLASAAPPEVRATWLSGADGGPLASAAAAEATMRSLRDVGLNTVYVDCWADGRAAFPSRVLRAASGAADDAGEGRDRLAVAVIAAHRNGLLCIARFEGGFSVATGDARNPLRKKREWITTTPDGRDVSGEDGRVYLNPFHPDVQQFLIGLALDALERHDLDGVQFDEHLGLPVDLGYDPYTRELYRQETGRAVPADPRDADWMKWRADELSDFALRLVSELRDARPDLLLSVAPLPSPASYDARLSDWVRWSQWCYCGGRRWTEYVPQTYHADGAATLQAIRVQAEAAGDERFSLVAGIRVDAVARATTFDGVRDAIALARENDLAGHSFSSGVALTGAIAEPLKAFYDVEHQGASPNPFNAAGWRPPPVVAVRAGDAWRADVAQAGRYRVIARSAGAWREVRSVDLTVGTHTIEAAGDAVELLIDRRP